MLLKKSIGDEKFSALQSDPCAFVQAFDDRDPWDFQKANMREAVRRRADGKFERPIVIISKPRQNSKSTMSAWLGAWRLFTAESHQQVVTVANDRSQAGIILNDGRRLVGRSNVLYNLLDDFGLTRSTVRLKDGREWIVKSSDSIFARGLRPTCLLYDELGFSPDRELFDTLSAGMAAAVNPLTVVTSTVGRAQSGVLFELFKAYESGDSAIRLIYTEKNESPLITEEYLERQRSILPPHVYKREHENRWSAGTGAFATQADWESALEDGNPIRSDDPGPTFAYLDLGWSHDESVYAVSKKQPDEKAAIIHMAAFRGTPERPVELAAVEESIRQDVEKFNIKKLMIEAPQGLGAAQRLAVDGLDTELVYPTRKHQNTIWGHLQVALKQRKIRLPDDPLLRRQILGLVLVQGATGWRVDADKRIHQDRALACAGAAWMASKEVPKARVMPLIDREVARSQRRSRGLASVMIHCPGCRKRHLVSPNGHQRFINCWCGNKFEVAEQLEKVRS